MANNFGPRISKLKGVVTISESIDIEGLLEQIPRTLEKGSVGTRESAMKKGIKTATKIVQVSYKSRVPRGETGNLRRSIITNVKAYQDGKVWFGIAGARHGIGNHMHLIEEGHEIRRRGKRGESAKGQKLEPLTGKTRTEARHDLLKAIDTTQMAQDHAFVGAIVQAIIDAGG